MFVDDDGNELKIGSSVIMGWSDDDDYSATGKVIRISNDSLPVLTVEFGTGGTDYLEAAQVSDIRDVYLLDSEDETLWQFEGIVAIHA